MTVQIASGLQGRRPPKLGLLVPPNERWLAAVHRLRTEFGASPVFVVGDDRKRGGWSREKAAEINSHFVSLHQVDRTLSDLVAGRGGFPYSPVPHEELPQLEGDLLALGRIGRRYFPLGITTPARDVDRLAQDALDLANSIISAFSPDFVIQADVPHGLLDYAIASICRVRGVGHISYRSTWSRDFYAVVLNDSAIQSDGWIPPEIQKEFADHLRGYMKAAQGDYGDYLLATGVEKTRPRALPNGSASGAEAVKRRIRTLYSVVTARGGGRERSLWNRSHNQGPAELAAFRFIRGLKSTQLARSYGRLSRPLSGLGEYAFMAFHYQPEATTLPLAGNLVNQVRTALYLRSLLPPSIELVVKEHPRQFQKGWEGGKERSVADYELLAGTPGITLVSIEADQFDLVDGANMVITATGTIGAEAIARGKQVLTFGNPWYGQLPGAHSIDSFTLSGLRELLGSIDPHSGNNEDAKWVLEESLLAIARGVFPGDRRGMSDPNEVISQAAISFTSSPVSFGLEAGIVAALGLSEAKEVDFAVLPEPS